MFLGLRLIANLSYNLRQNCRDLQVDGGVGFAFWWILSQYKVWLDQEKLLQYIYSLESMHFVAHLKMDCNNSLIWQVKIASWSGNLFRTSELPGTTAVHSVPEFSAHPLLSVWPTVHLSSSSLPVAECGARRCRASLAHKVPILCEGGRNFPLTGGKSLSKTNPGDDPG